VETLCRAFRLQTRTYASCSNSARGATQGDVLERGQERDRQRLAQKLGAGGDPG
jgi:hypothetical protein